MQNKDLPKGWKIVKLKDYIVDRKEKNKENESLTVFSVSNKRGLVRSDDYFEGQVYSKNLKTYKKIYKGDFGYNPARINVGSIACLDNDDIGLLSPMYVIFSLKEGINKDYFKFFIKGNLFNKQVNNFTQGAVRQILNFKDLGKIQILLPPLNVQEEIAEKLVENSELIEKSKELIEKYENIKKGMMKKLFTEGIGHTEFKEDKYLGKIPKVWKVGKLGDNSIITMGQSPSGESYNEIGKGILFLQGKREFGYMYPNVTLYTSEPKKILKENTLLLSVRAPIGDLNISDKKYCIGRGLAGIEEKNNITKFKYLYYYLVLIKDNISNMGEGAVFTAINKNVIENIKIPITSIDEQNRIISLLENIDNILEREKEIKNSYENIRKGIVSLVFSCNLLIK